MNSNLEIDELAQRPEDPNCYWNYKCDECCVEYNEDG